MNAGVAEAFDVLERYERELQAMLTALGSSEPSLEALEATAQRARQATAGLTLLENSRGALESCSAGERVRLAELQERLHALRAHVNALAAERAAEIAAELERSLEERRRRGSYRASGSAAGDSCDVRA